MPHPVIVPEILRLLARNVVSFSHFATELGRLLQMSLLLVQSTAALHYALNYPDNLGLLDKSNVSNVLAESKNNWSL